MRLLRDLCRSLLLRINSLAYVALALVILFACGTYPLMAADSRSVNGVVRDERGQSLPGAVVTLTDSQAAATTRQTKTGPAGEYSFTEVTPGEDTVTAALDGYAMSSVAVPASSTAAPVDITLKRVATVAPSSVPVPKTSAPSPGPLQFQASGIHGLIDPGGYSASASADAATGLLRGMADVKRADGSLGASSAKNWPCDLEPDLRKAVAEHPDREGASRSLGQFYLAHHQPDKALALLQQALQMDGNDYAASRDIGIAWLQRGQFDEARKQFVALVERHEEPELHQLLAKADEGSGMFRQAAEEYRKADAGSPGEEGSFGVGYELILAGSPAEALPAFEAGLEKYPRSVTLHIAIGAAQFLLSQFSQAVDSFLVAVDVDPADPRAYSFLAAASGLSAAERDRVGNAFRRYSEIAPGSADANYFYALILMRGPSAAQYRADGETTKIESLLKRAIRIDPAMAKAHLQLADLYAARNNYEAAMPEYETAVRIDPALSEAHYRLAIAYKRAGHAEQSAREMQIFQQKKAMRASASGDSDFDVAQFISVIDTPARHAVSETQCNENAH